jgi:hypothetical protein
MGVTSCYSQPRREGTALGRKNWACRSTPNGKIGRRKAQGSKNGANGNSLKIIPAVDNGGELDGNVNIRSDDVIKVDGQGPLDIPAEPV